VSPAGYLLDTHVFLWLAGDDTRLSAKVRELALDAGNPLSLSVASVWELAIKASLGKLRLDVGLGELIESQRAALGLTMLRIETAHVLEVETLEYHHRDPFDRLLVAQARVERLTIVSRDTRLDDYDVERVW
jgi:PIN domain nuclease of toxin-antitoxin system